MDILLPVIAEPPPSPPHRPPSQARLFAFPAEFLVHRICNYDDVITPLAVAIAIAFIGLPITHAGYQRTRPHPLGKSITIPFVEIIIIIRFK